MRIALFVILLSIVMSTSAQESDLPPLSNYQHNWMIYNPAYTGSTDVLSFSGFIKKTKFSDPGGPAYEQGSVQMPWGKHVAMGVSLYGIQHPTTFGEKFSDAPLKTNSFSLNYAYRIPIKDGKLSFGLSGGLTRTSSSLVDKNFLNANDPQFFKDDEVDIDPIMLPLVGTGVLYYTKKLFVGLSVPNFFSLDSIGNYTSGIKNYTGVLTGGYEFGQRENFTFNPTFLLMYGLGADPMDYALSINFGFFDQKIWLGAIYKSGGMMSVNMNLEIRPKILLGVSYDYSLTSTTSYYDQSVELVLRYELRKRVRSNVPFYY